MNMTTSGRTVLLICTVLSLFINSNAQTNRDSLIIRLKQAGLSIDHQLKLHYDLAVSYKHVNPDSGFLYARRGLSLAKEHNFDIRQNDFYAILGYLFEKTDKYDSALFYHNKNLSWLRENGSSSKLRTNALMNLGNVYYLKSDFHTSLKQYTDALTLAIDSNDEPQQGMIHNNLGLVYWKLNQNEDAKKYLEKAYKINSKMNESALSTTLNNFANVYYAEDNIKKVIEYDSLSLLLNIKFNNKFRMAINYNNIGESYSYLGQDDKAKEYFEKAILLREEIDHKHGIAKACINMGVLFMNGHDFKSAKPYLMRALSISNNIKSPDLKKNTLYYLKSMEAGLGNFEKAMEYSEEFILLNDSLFNGRKSKQIAELMTKYETEQKEKENLTLKSEALIQAETIKKQNLTILLFVLGSVSLIFISFLAYRTAKLRKKQKEQAERDKSIIEEQKEKLRELDLAKSRFFTNISHDVRSPLTLILGSAEQILKSQDSYLTNADESKLKTINKNGKRLLLMMDEIRDLTMLENDRMRMNFVPVNIVPYLGMLVKLFSSAADYKNIELKYHADTNLTAFLSIDPYQFEKIIYNLLSNAIKYTQDHGEIVVDVVKKNDKAVVRITDNGQGIPKESVNHIFERYYQTTNNNHTAKEGLGVGLALVKEIVQLHNGKIDVESQEGKGTTFDISFPMVEVSDSQVIVPELGELSREKFDLDLDLMEKTTSVKVKLDQKQDLITDHKILLVEDHSEVRHYIASLLNDQYDVITAQNGTIALQKLEKQKIDLVITDLMMPYMDGYELMDHLKNEERFMDIPVLVLSARTSHEDKMKVLEKGVNNMLAKPFDQEELVSKVDNLIKQKIKWDNNSKHAIFLSNEDTKSDVEQKLIEKLEQLIINRVSDPHLSVMDLGYELAASERQVYRMVKKLVGLTPFEYIKEVKMQYVEHLIKNKKVEDNKSAMEAIGMSNVTDFSNQFKKRFGKKPADYFQS